MSKRTVQKLAVRLDVGDVITEYPNETQPERLGESGRWTVIRRSLPEMSGLVHVDYETPDGEGLFVIDMNTYVTVEPIRS